MGIPCYNHDNVRRNRNNIIIQNMTNNINEMNIYNNLNNKNIFLNSNLTSGASCPSCNEPSGNNFMGSGDKTEYFDCLKCGEHQSGKTYYHCKICNGIFCTQCPFNNYRILKNNYNNNSNNFASCPACGEPSGNNFRGSGDKTEYFDCLKCGKHQSGKTYYHCKKCNGIFCAKCPFNNNNINKNNFMNKSLYSCPACGEPSGKLFKGSGDKTEYFDCLKCGKHQSGKTYYHCNICNGIFCSNCPQYNDGIFASCASCGEHAGDQFKGSGYNTQYFDCLKCGKHQSGKSYYKCKNCNGIFCYNCPFRNR